MTRRQFGSSRQIPIAIFCLCLCPNSESSEIAGYPKGWPQLGDETTLECYSFSSVYRSQGFGSSTLSLEFEQPVFERNFYGMEDVASPKNHFQIEIDIAQQEMVTRIFSDEGLQLAVRSERSGFECVGGWITFFSSYKGGNGESPHISSNLTTQLRTAIDGSLIVRSLLKSYSRKFLLFKKEQVSETWYWYPIYKQVEN